MIFFPLKIIDIKWCDNIGKQLISEVKNEKALHPNYHEIEVTCACGNTFKTGSTVKGKMK